MVAAKSRSAADLAARIRLHVLRMTSLGGSSHIASAFSIAEILGVLYADVLRHRPDEPEWPERDRFVLSKGHAGAAMYAVLAECGYFPVERLDTHYADGSVLSGHVSHKGVAGVEVSTGSLGHGLGIATGFALAGHMTGAAHRAFALLSDGECDEGSTWEAALFAAHHRLDNLVAVIDYNKIQSLAPVAETIQLEPFADKWRSFGWLVRETDGHDCAGLREALATRGQERPLVVIAHTTKGKGVSFMENSVLWHYRSPQGEEYEAALRELEAARASSRRTRDG